MKTIRNSPSRLLLIIFFLFLFIDQGLAQGHENVIAEAVTRYLIIQAAIGLSVISFLLLIIMRNKYLGMISIFSGIVLIVVCNEEICRYLLTDELAEWCISFALLQIPFSYILGRIYPRRPRHLPKLSPEETLRTKHTRRESVLKLVFIFSILTSIYGSINFYAETDMDPSLTLIIVLNAGSLIFFGTTTYLFATRIRAGWILGTAWLLSVVLTILTNLFFTIRNSFTYSIPWSPYFITLTAIYLSCFTICLTIIFAAPIKEKFNVNRKHLIVAIIAGILLGGLSYYEQIMMAEVRGNMYMKKRMEDRY